MRNQAEEKLEAPQVEYTDSPLTSFVVRLATRLKGEPLSEKTQAGLARLMGLLGSADRLGSVCISLHEWECAQRIADNRSVSEVEDLNADSPEAKSPPKKLEIHWNRDETKPFLDECVAMGLIAVPATLEDPRSFDPERSEAILCWDRMAPSWGEERLYTLRRFSEEVTPVSYTHLTLPTTERV